jgi:hypothetical protein
MSRKLRPLFSPDHAIKGNAAYNAAPTAWIAPNIGLNSYKKK